MGSKLEGEIVNDILNGIEIDATLKNEYKEYGNTFEIFIFLHRHSTPYKCFVYKFRHIDRL